MEQEIFKEIPGYDDYQISSLGRVKSFKYGKERILKPGIDGAGYYYVNLYKNKKRESKKVHILVTITFMDHIPNGYEIVIDHINENRLDNRVENLQLITHRKNVVKSHLSNDNLSSQFTGVCWNKRDKKWQAQIQINKKLITFGYFDDELYASMIYQKAFELMDQYDGCNKTFRNLVKTSI